MTSKPLGISRASSRQTPGLKSHHLSRNTITPSTFPTWLPASPPSLLTGSLLAAAHKLTHALSSTYSVCSALYCELSAGLSCQAVSSGEAGYSCLPVVPSPTPPLPHCMEVNPYECEVEKDSSKRERGERSYCKRERTDGKLRRAEGQG